LVQKVIEGNSVAISEFLNLSEEKAWFDSLILEQLEEILEHSRMEDLSQIRKDKVLENELTIGETAELINEYNKSLDLLTSISKNSQTYTIGITGRGGAGKSTLIDELIFRYLKDERNSNRKLAIIAVDPSPKSGGAVLKDRVGYTYGTNRRYLEKSSEEKFPDDQAFEYFNRIFIRSVASRGYGRGICRALPDMIKVMKSAGYDVIVETYGTGQEETDIVDLVNQSVFVTTPDMGGENQILVENMLDIPNVYVVLNKQEKEGSGLIKGLLLQKVKEDRLFLTTASEHNDPGVDKLYDKLAKKLHGG